MIMNDSEKKENDQPTEKIVLILHCVPKSNLPETQK